MHETPSGRCRVQTISVDPAANDRIHIVPELHPVGAAGSGRATLHVTCDGTHVEGSPFDVRLQPTSWIWSQLSKAPAEGPADRYTPIYGEINETGVARILSWWRDNARLGADSVFMEAGSGRGKPCFLAKLQFGVGTVIGVEVVPERRFIAEYLRRVLLRSGISSMDEISFLVSDLCVGAASPIGSAIAAAGEHDEDTDMGATPWSALTHWYTFDTGFPPDVMEAVGKLINSLIHRGGALEHFACFHSPDRLAEVGFDMKTLRLAHKTVVNMEGSAQGHTCYIYSTQPQLALERWTEDEGLYVDPNTLEMICSSSDEDSGDDDGPEVVFTRAKPQASDHTWITMQIQVPKGMLPGQVCKIFDPHGGPHFVKIPRECRPLPGKSVSDLHFVKQIPTRYTTSVLRTLDSDELRQWLRHRGQKLPRNTRYEVLLNVACNFIYQARDPIPNVPHGWQAHWSSEYNRWYFVHAEKEISCWKHPNDSPAQLNDHQPDPEPRKQTNQKSNHSRGATNDVAPQLYAELFARIPKPKTAKALAEEFNDRELRTLMKCNGIKLNTVDVATDKYVEKAKLDKCKSLATTTLKRPAMIKPASSRSCYPTLKPNAQLLSSLPRDLSWNDFQREARAIGYSSSNAELAQAWREYSYPPSAAIAQSSLAPKVSTAAAAAAAQLSSASSVKNGPKLTAAQRQAALDLSQDVPGLRWNDFQQHASMRTMLDRLDGNIVNKNAVLAAVWRQYQADQQPAAAAHGCSALQHVAFAPGDKVIWVCHDKEVLEGEIGICTGNFDRDGDPELKFTIGGWIGCLPSEELVLLPPGTYAPSSSGSVSASAPSSSAAAKAGASRAPSRSAELSIPMPIVAPQKAPVARSAWTTKEEDFLLQHVTQHGARRWNDCAAELGTRTACACEQHYRLFLRPVHSQKEGRLALQPIPRAASALEAASTHAAASSAASDLGSRSQPLNRPVAGGWTKREDDVLVEHIERRGVGSWPVVAAAVSAVGAGRSSSACRSRYRDAIEPQQRARPAPPLISEGNGSTNGAEVYASLPSGLDWKAFQTRIRVFGNAASTYWRTYRSRSLNPRKQEPENAVENEGNGEGNDEGDERQREGVQKSAKISRPRSPPRQLLSKAQLAAKLPRFLSWNDFQREAVSLGYLNSNAELAEAWRHYKDKSNTSSVDSAAQRKSKRGADSPDDVLPPKKLTRVVPLPATAPRPATNRSQTLSSAQQQSRRISALRKRSAGASADARRPSRVRKQVVRPGMVDITQPGISLVNTHSLCNR